MDIHNLIKIIVEILVIVGALNWGLVGLLGLDLVAKILGAGSMLARIVYVLVGLAGLDLLLIMLKIL